MYQEATTFLCKKVQGDKISTSKCQNLPPPEMIRFTQSRCRIRLGYIFEYSEEKSSVCTLF